MQYQHISSESQETQYGQAEPFSRFRTHSLKRSSVVKRKPLPSVQVQPLYHTNSPANFGVEDKSENNAPQDHSVEGAAWAPGFWKRLPLFSSLSMLGVIGCTAASVVILAVSNGSDVRNWAAFTPSVYLAIFSTIANTLMGFALAEGLAVSYWQMMLKGCKLSQLNWNWECGSNIQSALTQVYKRGGRVTAIARIIATLSLLRGPLYQKASSVDVNHVETTQSFLDLGIAREIPNGYTSVSLNTRIASIRQTARLSAPFTGIMNGFAARSNMTLSYSECGDICYTTVQGFGFKANCTQSEIYTNRKINGTDPYDQLLFDTNVALWIPRENSSSILNVTGGLTLNTTFYEGHNQTASNTTYRMYLTSHICSLTPSIVEYDVELVSGTVILGARGQDRYLQPINLIAPNYFGGNNTLGGFQYAGDYLFKSNADYSFSGGVSTTIVTGALANQMLKNVNDNANYIFNDPMVLMLDSMREIAFRTSLVAGQTNSSIPSQRVAVTGVHTYSVYRTNWAFLVLGLMTSIAGLLSTLATFHGWWRFGRDVSLNPLEVSKAFSAPLLHSAGSNVSFQTFPDHATDFDIRYGYLDGDRSEPSTTRLLVGDASRIHGPQKGQVFH